MSQSFFSIPLRPELSEKRDIFFTVLIEMCSSQRGKFRHPKKLYIKKNKILFYIDPDLWRQLFKPFQFSRTHPARVYRARFHIIYQNKVLNKVLYHCSQSIRKNLPILYQKYFIVPNAPGHPGTQFKRSKQLTQAKWPAGQLLILLYKSNI